MDSCRDFPPGIEIGDFLGEGKRSRVYWARFHGQEAVVKCYKPKFVDKYRQRYGVCIAEFEYGRNLAFYENQELRPYTVKPLAVFSGKDAGAPVFVQAVAPGRPMLDVIRELGFLPDETFRAGLQLVASARRAGIHDLDINDGNVNLQATERGWMPVVYDFNIMPQYLFPTNPVIALGFWLRIRDRSYRDERSVRGWRMRGRQAEQNEQKQQ